MDDRDIRVCAQCGQPMIRKPDETRKYFSKKKCCSYECSYLHKREPVLEDRFCMYCGKKLVRRQQEERANFLTRQYCNRSCFHKACANKLRRPMKRGIYQIRNTANEKVYIGASRNMLSRWHRHRVMLRQGIHYSKLLQDDWNEYGEQAFIFSAVEIIDSPGEMFTKEQIWFDRTRCTDIRFGYNTDPIAGSRLGATTSEETKRRISIGNKGKHLGSLYPSAILNESDVVDIKRRLHSGESQISISRIYGVSSSLISAISRNMRWTHVPWPTS